MAELGRRLQVLLDDERYHRLQRESERSGAAVGELVRRAIDREYPSDLERRAAAAERLLGASPPPGPEPDWEAVKDDMLDELHRA